MTFKKKLLASLCALALLLTLSPAPVQASGDVIFLALNDQVVPRITSGTMPIWYGNAYFIPYSVFDMNYMSTNFGIAVDLGVRVAAGDGNIMLYNKRRQLIYDLDAGTCVDQQGNSYRNAITRGGIVYLPVATVASFFSEGGLSYYQLDTPYGPLLRLTTPSVALGNEEFVDAASGSHLPQILRDYNKTQTPLPSPSPAQPTPSTPSPSDNPTPDRPGVRVQLSFLVTDGEGTASLLDLLDQEGLHALFLLRPETLSQYENLIRRMVGSGHALGFLLPGGPGEDAKAQLREGNRLLALIARTNTHTVALEQEDSATVSALTADGWSLWRHNVPVPSATATQGFASSLLRSAEEKRTVARFLLGDSALVRSALPLLLEDLQSGAYSFRLPVGDELS